MFFIIDIGILLLLLMGAIVGFKRGFIKQTVMFLGTILVIVLAYFLKNPVASLFYSIFPFIDFGNSYSVVLNILMYEVIAFLLVAAILFALLNILIKFTNVFEKILNATIILGIPSKLLGALMGVLQYFVVIFFVLYLLNLPILNLNLTNNTKVGSAILNNTPVLSNMFDKELNAASEIIELNSKYANRNSEAYNLEALDIMLKNNIISVKSANILLEKDKIDFDGAEEIINQYE